MKISEKQTILVVGVLAACAGGAGGQVAISPPGVPDEASPRHMRHVIPLGARAATLPDGRVVPMQSETVWKPICSNKAPMTANDLAKMASRHDADFADPARVTRIDTPRPYGARAGLDVVFVLGASVPAAAVPAFTAAEAYLQGQFTGDTMTVTIPVSFASLSPGVIGGTSSTSGYLSWTDMRSTLVAGKDANDTIHNFLPSGSTIPVRYSSGSTTNETRVFITWANFKANGGSVSGNDGSMQYSTNFPFDYDPSNGVATNTISLQDVIVHETGHALGCTSGIDFRFRDIEVMDVFRFQRTDGSADYNPDTTAEFQVRPRMGIYNYQDDHNLDIISGTEYRLADGSPYQASHFREQVPAIGIMDPAFSYGETFYPNFLRTSDITLFDAIGYDR